MDSRLSFSHSGWAHVHSSLSKFNLVTFERKKNLYCTWINRSFAEIIYCICICGVSFPFEKLKCCNLHEVWRVVSSNFPKALEACCINEDWSYWVFKTWRVRFWISMYWCEDRVVDKDCLKSVVTSSKIQPSIEESMLCYYKQVLCKIFCWCIIIFEI